jgi:hypothetical protein
MNPTCHFTVYGSDLADIEAQAHKIASEFFGGDRAAIGLAIYENPDARSRKDGRWKGYVAAARRFEGDRSDIPTVKLSPAYEGI